MWIVRKVEKLMLACTSARISIGKVAVNPRLPWLDHKCLHVTKYMCIILNLWKA